MGKKIKNWNELNDIFSILTIKTAAFQGSRVSFLFQTY